MISIVIPIGPTDTWEPIYKELSKLNNSPHEIIFAFSHAQHNPMLALPQNTFATFSNPGRAQQMNTGAKRATGQFVWFVHADSKLHQKSLTYLANQLSKEPEALHYFDLKFSDGSFLMKLNEWGALFRSRILELPFGDQGLCLSRDLFLSLNGYSEHVSYGEDHLLVWKVRQKKLSLHALKIPIFTSARKYQTHGWLKTTLKTMWLTFIQAIS